MSPPSNYSIHLWSSSHSTHKYQLLEHTYIILNIFPHYVFLSPRLMGPQFKIGSMVLTTVLLRLQDEPPCAFPAFWPFWSGSNPPLYGSPTGFSPTDCCLLQAEPGMNQSFVLIYRMPAVFLFLKPVTQYSSLWLPRYLGPRLLVTL